MMSRQKPTAELVVVSWDRGLSLPGCGIGYCVLVVTFEQFSLAARCCPDRDDPALLMKFCLLYGTKLVFEERAWYLEHKCLTPEASTRMRTQLLDLCDSVKDDALRVTSAFNIPHTSLHAPPRGSPTRWPPGPFTPRRRSPGPVKERALRVPNL
ncbi:hypothetical protein mRhiFer1_000214 [Rhinolophus ferrumequinum]|uniref:Acyl-CoA oxidase C-terminal domain-containing protein n=1 Tax=Rhinolophus ferrumequinum TaxID=59479 RepID=A0A7J7R2N5_RHIFE|nr:hypothetical protein mRhiFer1_000214 [Rhinolophus ferrumequinum]